MKMSGVPVALSSALTLSLRARSSACTEMSTACSLRMRATASSNADRVRDTRCNAQPSAARPFATAKPMPFDAPVTTALLPARSNFIWVLPEVELQRVRARHGRERVYEQVPRSAFLAPLGNELVH